MQSIKAEKGQWLGDIVVQETGDLSHLFEVALLNGISITDPIGVLAIDENLGDMETKSLYKVNGFKPATGDGGVGIGYYLIPTPV